MPINNRGGSTFSGCPCTSSGSHKKNIVISLEIFNTCDSAIEMAMPGGAEASAIVPPSEVDMTDELDPQNTVLIKWSGREYLVDVMGLELVDVLDLKKAIMGMTGVHFSRQKLLNLKHKGKLAEDSCSLSDLSLKPRQVIMMMGSLEKDIASMHEVPDDLPEVVNDLDIPLEADLAIPDQIIYKEKVEKRIKEYNVEITNPLREGKKLLVLDIDYTLFDHLSPAETGAELMRPYLHEFLTEAYKDYDIVIWSATSMKWIMTKMKLLHVTTHPDYKIAFYLDSAAMINVHTDHYGLIKVKPLGVIWGKFPQFSNKNTIMFDDVRRNFIMNPQSGLRIRPFRSAHLNRDKDRELVKLSTYLSKIANLEDFTVLNHRKWESYKK